MVKHSTLRIATPVLILFCTLGMSGCYFFQPPLNHVGLDIVFKSNELVFQGYKKYIRKERELKGYSYYISSVEVYAGDEKAWLVWCNNSTESLDEYRFPLPDSVTYGISPCVDGTTDTPAIELPYNEEIIIGIGIVGFDRHGELKKRFSAGPKSILIKNKDGKLVVVLPRYI